MGELIVELSGTEAGEAFALALVMLSAMAHAVFGAINKGGADPFLNRGAINVCYGLITLPIALFVVPWPTPWVWTLLFTSYLIHILYEYLQASAFSQGDFTIVYPIARGTGPMVTMLLALVVFHERFSLWQWVGGIGLSASIIGLALVNIRRATHLPNLRGALLAALATGVMVAVYTTFDAYGIRQAVDPFSFIVWFFTLGGVGFPLIAAARWHRLPIKPAFPDIALRGFFGGLIALLSFGSIMLATRLGSVGEAAALRETSIIFATAIGVLVFHEKIDATRLSLIAGIAGGAILVEFG